MKPSPSEIRDWLDQVPDPEIPVISVVDLGIVRDIRWDGDTLVVVTDHFNGLAASFGSSGTSAEKVLTERFTRVSYDTVNYEWTLEDAATYTDKISAIVPMTKVAGQIYEYACHEGNYGMVNILRGARMEEKRQAAE